MANVYIVEAFRSPIGGFKGSLQEFNATDIASEIVKEILKKNPHIKNSIEQLILGNVLTAGLGMGPARQVGLMSGLNETIPAYGVNMICGSGMQAVIDGFNCIQAKKANLILVGGMESMSNAGFVLAGKTRSEHKMGDLCLEDTILKDGLTDGMEGFHMGITAENIASEFSISREAQDEYAYQSQVKANQAIDKGYFEAEIVPIELKNKHGITRFEKDEYPRKETTLEKLSRLKPAFKEGGTVTPGNASGMNDGASVILLASEEALLTHQLKPLAQILDYSSVGLSPRIMGMGPYYAVKKLLTSNSLAIDSVDMYELNEAFASQSLAVLNALTEGNPELLKYLSETMNVCGGAIALGHPIGASGARIITTLVHQLIRTKGNLGVASLCIGGGMGLAILLKSIQP